MIHRDEILMFPIAVFVVTLPDGTERLESYTHPRITDVRAAWEARRARLSRPHCANCGVPVPDSIEHVSDIEGPKYSCIRPVVDHGRLRRARESAGMSAVQASRWLNCSVDRIEAGRDQASSGCVADMAELYGVSVAWLLGSDADVGSEP